MRTSDVSCETTLATTRMPSRRPTFDAKRAIARLGKPKQRAERGYTPSQPSRNGACIRRAAHRLARPARLAHAGGAGQGGVRRCEVISWFHEGTDALRIIALNLMLANDDYRDFLAVLDTLDTPHRLFGQFYGLLLARAMLPDLHALQNRLLGDAMTRARHTRRFRRDEPLMELGQELVEWLHTPS